MRKEHDGQALNNHVGFHDQSVARPLGARMPLAQRDTQFTYTFENFFHPFVGELIAKLNQGLAARNVGPRRGRTA